MPRASREQAAHAAALLPLMLGKPAAIINTASRGGKVPPLFNGAYAVAKAGVIALSKSIAVQFAKDGIRSNVILPGGTDSPMQARWARDPALKATIAAGVPLGRVGTTEDMANACLFLLSDQAGFVTGTELIVDGGRTALP